MNASTIPRPLGFEEQGLAIKPVPQTLSPLLLLVPLLLAAWVPGDLEAESRSALPPDGRMHAFLGEWKVTAVGMQSPPSVHQMTARGEWLVPDRVMRITYTEPSGRVALQQVWSYDSYRKQFTFHLATSGRRAMLTGRSTSHNGGMGELELIGNLPHPVSGEPRTCRYFYRYLSPNRIALSWWRVGRDGMFRSVLDLDHQRMDPPR